MAPPEPLSPADAARFEDLRATGAEGAEVHAFCARLPIGMRAPYCRDALARLAFAKGLLPHSMAGSPSAGMVRLRDAAGFRGVVPDDDPHRIRVVPDDRPPLRGPAVAEPTPDFHRYCRDICQARAKRAPFVSCSSGVGPGVLVAGGTPANEAILPESGRAPVSLKLFVGGADVCDGDGSNDGSDSSDNDGEGVEPEVEVRTYALKGGSVAPDVDNFISLQTLDVDRPDQPSGLTDRQKRDAARSVACGAAQAAEWRRFAPSDVCCLCQQPVVTGGFVKCHKARTLDDVHVFHAECIASLPDAGERHDPCPVPGCTHVLEAPSRVADMAREWVCMSATRSTVNVRVPSLASKSGGRVAWQLTSRVYEDWRQVLVGFDMAPSQVCYDGEDVWMTEMAAVAIANGVIPVSPFLLTSTCEMRLIKYIVRFGFELYDPLLTQADYDALRPDAVRGIAGLKWLAERVRCGATLDSAWLEFARLVKEGGKEKLHALQALGCDRVPDSVYAMFARPYVPALVPVDSLLDADVSAAGRAAAYKFEAALEAILNKNPKADMHHLRGVNALGRAGGLKIPYALRLRMATRDGNPVSAAYDMVHLLNFHTVDPGRQTFYQATFERHRNAREGKGPLSSITSTSLWRKPFDLRATWAE